MAEPSADRRTFLGFCTGLLMALLTAALAVPALAYALAPVLRWRGSKRTAGGDFQDVGAVDAIPVDHWTLVTLERLRRDGWEETRSRHGVWVRRRVDKDQVDVLSSICPHLGCPLNWHPDHAQFVCPCHGGTFSAEGQLEGGPPPRSMDPLEHRIQDGHLWVRWQDFRIGVTERIPVSS